MGQRLRPAHGTERRVLVLAVPDLLDTTIALRTDGNGPARTIAYRLRDSTPRSVEYTATRVP